MIFARCARMRSRLRFARNCGLAIKKQYATGLGALHCTDYAIALSPHDTLTRLKLNLANSFESESTMKQSLLMICLVALAGCAQKAPPTVAEMDSALLANQQQATRVYPNQPPMNVRKAAYQALELLDQGDMKFDVRTNELLATRRFFFYAIFAMTVGREWYSLSTVAEGDGTKATLGFDSAFNASVIPIDIPESFKSNISISAQQNPADYKLFHDRVEYLLGLRTNWVTCDQAKRQQPNPKREMLFCDQIGLENLAPASTLK